MKTEKEYLMNLIKNAEYRKVRIPKRSKEMKKDNGFHWYDNHLTALIISLEKRLDTINKFKK